MNAGDGSPTVTALEALERFVVDNDDLLALEERIGRFNIFDALGIARTEIRHSNFLAWLLDPAESHGQGSLFLKAILMDLLRNTQPDQRPLSPVELDGEELRGIEIRREWKNIDILIKCDEPPFVIAIENKIDSSEHSGQLERYEATLAQDPDLNEKPMFVFLTTDASEPSDDDWVSYSYQDIHRVLERVHRTNAGAIGEDVAAFLGHYLRLIGSRFMEDPKIDELCRRIYRNHRQAIDLIVDRVATPGGVLLTTLQESLESDPTSWYVFNRTSKRLDFVPTAWHECTPDLCARPKWHPKAWIRWWVLVDAEKAVLIVEVGPCKEQMLRRLVIERLTSDQLELGFKVTGKGTEKWTRLRRATIANWSGEDETEIVQVVDKIRKRLDQERQRLAGVPDALRPIFEQWTARQVQAAQR